MAIPGVITAQTGAVQFNAPNFCNYSQFVGGTNATHHALMNYSPAMNKLGRVFMVRPPRVLLKMFGGSDGNLYNPNSLFIQFKHMLEYMNRSVTGFGDKILENASTPITGGFAQRQFNTPTITKINTTEVTFGLYELNGLPVDTVIDGWMNAIGDENSGLATYGGWISGGTNADGLEERLYRRSTDPDIADGIAFNEANHTCEFIYVLHDRSGAQVQKAVMLADCYPKGIQEGNILNMEQGQSPDNITYDITFNCVVYRGPIITAIANDLLKQYRIVSNSLNFNPELGDAVYADNDVSKFNKALGPVPTDSATGTNIGNMPSFNPTNTPTKKIVDMKDINKAKLSGQGGDYSSKPSWDGFGE